MIYWEGERGNKRKLEWERGDCMNEIMKNKKGRKARGGGLSSSNTFGTFLLSTEQKNRLFFTIFAPS